MWWFACYFCFVWYRALLINKFLRHECHTAKDRKVTLRGKLNYHLGKSKQGNHCQFLLRIRRWSLIYRFVYFNNLTVMNARYVIKELRINNRIQTIFWITITETSVPLFSRGRGHAPPVLHAWLDNQRKSSISFIRLPHRSMCGFTLSLYHIKYNIEEVKTAFSNARDFPTSSHIQSGEHKTLCALPHFLRYTR